MNSLLIRNLKLKVEIFMDFCESIKAINYSHFTTVDMCNCLEMCLRKDFKCSSSECGTCHFLVLLRTHCHNNKIPIEEKLEQFIYWMDGSTNLQHQWVQLCFQNSLLDPLLTLIQSNLKAFYAEKQANSQFFSKVMSMMAEPVRFQKTIDEYLKSGNQPNNVTPQRLRSQIFLTKSEVQALNRELFWKNDLLRKMHGMGNEKLLYAKNNVFHLQIGKKVRGYLCIYYFPNVSQTQLEWWSYSMFHRIEDKPNDLPGTIRCDINSISHMRLDINEKGLIVYVKNWRKICHLYFSGIGSESAINFISIINSLLEDRKYFHPQVDLKKIKSSGIPKWTFAVYTQTKGRNFRNYEDFISVPHSLCLLDFFCVPSDLDHLIYEKLIAKEMISAKAERFQSLLTKLDQYFEKYKTKTFILKWHRNMKVHKIITQLQKQLNWRETAHEDFEAIFKPSCGNYSDFKSQFYRKILSHNLGRKSRRRLWPILSLENADITMKDQEFRMQYKNFKNLYWHQHLRSLHLNYRIHESGQYNPFIACAHDSMDFLLKTGVLATKRVSLACSKKFKLRSSEYRKFCGDVIRIDKDIVRCDRDHPFFHSKNLRKVRNILLVYTMNHDDIGYIQGMCDLVAIVVFSLKEEPLAYLCFENIMNKSYKLFTIQSEIQRYNEDVIHLLEFLDPQLYHNIIKNSRGEQAYFTYRWFLLYFKREFCIESVPHVWDFIWCGESLFTPKFQILFATSFFQLYRNEIISHNMGFSDIHKFLQDLSEKHDYKRLIGCTMSILETLVDIFQ